MDINGTQVDVEDLYGVSYRNHHSLYDDCAGGSYGNSYPEDQNNDNIEIWH